MANVLCRLFLHLAAITAGKEEKAMLIRLYAGENIAEKITLTDVPPKLKAGVKQYLLDFGYPLDEE